MLLKARNLKRGALSFKLVMLKEAINVGEINKPPSTGEGEREFQKKRCMSEKQNNNFLTRCYYIESAKRQKHCRQKLQAFLPPKSPIIKCFANCSFLVFYGIFMTAVWNGG